MVIIKSQVINQGGKTFNRITSKSNYFGLGYNDALEVVLVTEYDTSRMRNGALKGGSVTDSMLNGFGSEGDTKKAYDLLIAEAVKRGLKFPEG